MYPCLPPKGLSLAPFFFWPKHTLGISKNTHNSYFFAYPNCPKRFSRKRVLKCQKGIRNCAIELGLYLQSLD